MKHCVSLWTGEDQEGWQTTAVTRERNGDFKYFLNSVIIIHHSIEKIPTVFNPISKHLEVCQNFNSLLCVWKSHETMSLMFDILHECLFLLWTTSCTSLRYDSFCFFITLSSFLCVLFLACLLVMPNLLVFSLPLYPSFYFLSIHPPFLPSFSFRSCLLNSSSRVPMDISEGLAPWSFCFGARSPRFFSLVVEAKLLMFVPLGPIFSLGPR